MKWLYSFMFYPILMQYLQNVNIHIANNLTPLLTTLKGWHFRIILIKVDWTCHILSSVEYPLFCFVGYLSGDNFMWVYSNELICAYDLVKNTNLSWFLVLSYSGNPHKNSMFRVVQVIFIWTTVSFEITARKLCVKHGK